VLRWERERIVERWGNLQELAGPSPDGHSMTDGENEVRDLEQTDEEQAPGARAHRRGLPEAPVPEAARVHLADDVRAAQPARRRWAGRAAGGRAAARPVRLSRGVLGQGNFVLAVSEISFDGKDAAVFDLFRVDKGRVVEHWDVLELTPPRET